MSKRLSVTATTAISVFLLLAPPAFAQRHADFTITHVPDPQSLFESGARRAAGRHGAHGADTDVLDSRAVSVRLDRLFLDSQSLARRTPTIADQLYLNLFPDVATFATLRRVDIRPPNSITWVGSIDGAPSNGTVALTVYDGVLHGTVRVYGRGLFRVRWVEGDHYEVQEIRAQGLRCEPLMVPPRGTPQPPAPQGGSGATSADDGSQIDVLVLYTDQARSGAGGQQQIDAAIDNAVSEANTALDNSEISTRLNLVQKQLVDYTESGESSTDLLRLQATDDGYMDSIHDERNALHADLVALVVETMQSGVGGTAYQMTNLGSDNAKWAFSVTKRTQLDDLTLAHELGHNMGCAHARDDYEDPGPHGVYSYSYGHHWIGLTGPYSTVMSYDHFFDLQWRISHFSNPDVEYRWYATGVAGPDGADNARTINNTAFTVANFRVLSTATPTPTPTQSVSPTATVTPGTCVGDCGVDGSTTVDELLTMVDIALGNAHVSTCMAGDANRDGQITVDEILTAVNNGLNGCTDKVRVFSVLRVREKIDLGPQTSDSGLRNPWGSSEARGLMSEAQSNNSQTLRPLRAHTT